MKTKQHIYEEGEIVYKKWFRSDKLINKFHAMEDNEKKISFCRELGIGLDRAWKMAQPDNVLYWATADKYATKLRLSSLHDMARLV